MAGIGNIGKDKLILDTSDLVNSDNVGAYIRSSDGTLITHTTVGAKEALDVYISGGQDLGIFDEDSAHSSGDEGQFVLAVRNDTKSALAGSDGDYIPFQMNSSGELYVVDEAGNVLLGTIDSSLDAIETSVASMDTSLNNIESSVASMDTSLNNIETSVSNIDTSLNTIEATTYLEDSGHTTGDRGIFALAVRNDSNAVLTSSDLDYSPIAVDDKGRLKVQAEFSVDFDYVYDEDSAHTDADPGAFVLAVRDDDMDGDPVSANGDYSAFKTNSRGGLWVVPMGNVADDAVEPANEYPLKVGSRSNSGALGQVSAANSRVDLLSDNYRRVWINKAGNIGLTANTVSVGTTEEEIASSPQSGRISIIVQNLGSKEVYLGPSGVTSSTGIALAPRANISLDLGEDVDLYAIAASGTQDIRYMELA